MHSWNRRARQRLGVARVRLACHDGYRRCRCTSDRRAHAITTRRVFAPSFPEAAFDLRFFSGPVKSIS
jgi:hypothetical protein